MMTLRRHHKHISAPIYVYINYKVDFLNFRCCHLKSKSNDFLIFCIINMWEAHDYYDKHNRCNQSKFVLVMRTKNKAIIGPNQRGVFLLPCQTALKLLSASGTARKDESAAVNVVVMAGVGGLEMGAGRRKARLRDEAARSGNRRSLSGMCMTCLVCASRGGPIH